LKKDNGMKHILPIICLSLTLFACNKTSGKLGGIMKIFSPKNTADETVNAKAEEINSDLVINNESQNISTNNRSAKNFIIAIDPGHQAKESFDLEQIGPGASQSKPKVAAGTQGVSTKTPEYQLTLEVSLKLRDELLARAGGYNVFMIRETNNVNISNKERAFMAMEAGADIFIRIHADGSENSNISGILTICQTRNNPYIPQLYAQSRALSEDILNAVVAATGAKNRGIIEVDNMSGINWSLIPATIVEMGVMTNSAEDRLMQTEEYQRKIVTGIADGIEKFLMRNAYE
jgi:N-acetylmuramoyl-L-alanine amidase